MPMTSTAMLDFIDHWGPSWIKPKDIEWWRTKNYNCAAILHDLLKSCDWDHRIRKYEVYVDLVAHIWIALFPDEVPFGTPEEITAKITAELARLKGLKK